MMQLVPGMAAAMRVAEAFADDPAAAEFWVSDLPEPETEDMVWTGAAGQPQPARRYRGGAGGVILYIHGGGWSGGSIALNERACRLLAWQSGMDVVSVSYRLAPAHPYPAGLEDCRAALGHLRAQAGDVPVILAGASAGANLALALALDERVAGLVLFYGVYGADMQTESYRLFAEGYGFTAERMAWLFALYDPGGRRRDDPRLCPLNATDAALAALPPAFLLAAGCDVLRDDTLQLAARLAALDVPHRLQVVPGVVHGFINRGRLVPAADACLKEAARFAAGLKEPSDA